MEALYSRKAEFSIICCLHFARHILGVHGLFAACFHFFSINIVGCLFEDDYDAGYLYHCQFSNKDDRFQYNSDRQDTIASTLPVPNTDPANGDDIPLMSILIR
jgi:hypothetical protein